MTGVLAAAGAVTGGLALRAKNDADNDAAQLGGSSSALQDANSQKHTLANVTDALLGSAIVAGGVTLYFALRHPKGPPYASTLSDWTVGVTPVGVVVSSEF